MSLQALENQADASFLRVSAPHRRSPCRKQLGMAESGHCALQLIEDVRETSGEDRHEDELSDADSDIDEPVHY